MSHDDIQRRSLTRPPDEFDEALRLAEDEGWVAVGTAMPTVVGAQEMLTIDLVRYSEEV